MKITIVGAGNIGTQFAVHCAQKGHEVTIYTSNCEKIQNKLFIVDENNQIVKQGEIRRATNDLKLAFDEAELIFITIPSFAMETLAQKIFPYVKNAYIGLIPGTGGGECCFAKFIEKNCTIFGLQRVPSVARLVEYGKSVKAIGYRDCLKIATIPKTRKIDKIVEDIFDIPCDILPNYLNITLTPSNPILHTTRLYSLFKNFNQSPYDYVPLFYEEWSDETSEILFKCDDEHQNICQKLSMFDLSGVKSLKIHYESDTPQKLTQKIRSIQGFKGLKSPTIEQDGKYIPDFNSRYFTADFPYGLSIIKQIANFVDVETKNIDIVLNWYKTKQPTIKEFNYSNYNINNLKEFIEFYNN